MHNNVAECKQYIRIHISLRENVPSVVREIRAGPGLITSYNHAVYVH